MQQLDLSNAWSELDPEQREWLLNSIALTNPEHRSIRGYSYRISEAVMFVIAVS